MDSGSVAGNPGSGPRDERPLPPLPTSESDVADREDLSDAILGGQRGAEASIIEGNDATRRNTSPEVTHQTSGNAQDPSPDMASNFRRLSDGPVRTPSTESSVSEANSRFVNEVSSGQGADSTTSPSGNPMTQEDGSSATARVESQTITSASLPRIPQDSPYAQNSEQAPRSTRDRLPNENSSGSDSAGDPARRGLLASRTRSRQHLDGTQSMEPTQFSVPRWQPDATVTICPICRTQFSFFVRKHHCRKCGRVVCGSCSPHRITIPHQYIVQPPLAEATTSSPPTRPRLDSGRTGSLPLVENLGGGERVRLCNPCVPDPNVAPPQVPESRPSPQGHIRSVSSVVTSTQSRSSTHSASISSPYHTVRRARDSMSSSHNTSTSSYMERNSRSRPDELQNRSRSSTVGMGIAASTPGQWTGPQGRSEQPQTTSNRPPRAPRPVIREEDECWICHKELPSRTLENWENVRAEHVNNCLVLAMQGPSPTPSTPPPAQTPAPINIPSQSPRTTPPSQPDSSQTARVTPTPAPPIANTPEARMAARERAHAAVVLAASSSSSPGGRRSGVFPYKATEKDCIDDAECTICMEEFWVGVDMGRLECFCRFHLACIRDWFTKKPGQCPVHQHGAGY